MKQWLKQYNKKLLKSIIDKKYDVKRFNIDKNTLRRMYIDTGVNGVEKNFDNYLDSLDKVLTTRKAQRYLELSKKDKLILKIELNTYFLTKTLENVLTKKEKKETRRKLITKINRDLNSLADKNRYARHTIREVKEALITEYENGLDGLKK